MEAKERRKTRQSLILCYERRLRELSEWIDLVDCAIEVYDNTDVEDGMSDDEIIENQMTRLGLLLKKQSLKLKNLCSKQQERSQARLLRERLMKEVDKWGKMGYFNLDGQVNNSGLFVAQKRQASGGRKDESFKIPSHRSPSSSKSSTGIFRIDRNGSWFECSHSERIQKEFPWSRNAVYQSDQLNNHSQVSSCSVDKCQVVKQHENETSDIFSSDAAENSKGILRSCVHEDVLGEKKRLNVTFALGDQDLLFV